MTMMAESIGVLLLSEHCLAHNTAPTAAALDLVPRFQLVVRLKNYTCDPTDRNRPIFANQTEKIHNSTLAEFLSLGPDARATLMSAMSFPDVDLLSHAYLGPAIMHYAVEEARLAPRLLRLKKLRVVATVKCVAGLGRERAGRKRVILPETPTETTYRYRATSTTVSCSLKLMRWGAGEGDRCAVCLEEFGSGEKVVRVPCRRHCIVNWMHRQSNCPLCRCCLEKRPKSDLQ